MGRPKFLAGIFKESSPVCPATLLGEDEQRLLLTTNAVSWTLLLILLCVWQWNKRRRLRRQSRRCSLGDSSTSLEQEALVAALQEELHAKSVAENEQAILWRQEKRILQSRIDELLQQQQQNGTSTTGNDSSQPLHEAQLLQQVKEAHETIAFLTSLTQSQTQELEAKQKEICKLHNILEEMQQHMNLEEKDNHLIATKNSTETETTGEDEDDDDADSISIDSSVEEDSVVVQEAAERGKCRLPERNKVVLLLSTMPGNLSTSVHQSRLEAIFRHGLQLESRFVETIDGCDTNLTTLRNDLFRISGLHAIYPQVFLVLRDQEIQFVGDFDTVQELHDTRELPQRIGLLLPQDEEKENAIGTNSSNNKYGNLGSVLLDSNTEANCSTAKEPSS